MLVSPVILAFVLTMAVFIRKELRDREVRTPLVVGLIAWILVIVLEVSFFFVFKRYAPDVERLLEETLEFGGTLLIGLSAGIALRGSRPPLSYIRRPPWVNAGSLVVRQAHRQRRCDSRLRRRTRNCRTISWPAAARRR